jgi:hypothetical protein
VVAKYVEALLARYQQEKLVERIEALHASVDLEMTEGQKQEWEAIDEIVATARVTADRNADTFTWALYNGHRSMANFGRKRAFGSYL